MRFETGSLSDNEVRLLVQQKLVEINWMREKKFAEAVVNAEDSRILELLIDIVQKEWLYQSPHVYRNAVHVLAYIGSETAVEALLASAIFFGKVDYSAAEESLRMIRNPASVDQLINALTSNISMPAKASIAYSLGQIRDQRAIPALLAALKLERSELTRAAINTLGTLRAPAVVPILIDAIEVFYAEYQFEVERALRRVNLPETADLLLARLRSGSSKQQSCCMQIAADLHLSEFVPVMLETLQHPSADMRLIAARSLWRLGEVSDARQPLLHLLTEDPSDAVRAEAAAALRHYHDLSTIEALIQAIDDDSLRVRHSAIYTLAVIDAKQVSGRLLQLAHEASELSTRTAAVHALGIMRISAAVPALIALLGAEMDSQVIEALGHIQTDEVVQALLAFYEQAHDRILKVRIIRALDGSSNPQVKPLLLDAFRDDHEWVRSAAVHALRNFPDQDTLPILLEALDDSDAAVCFRAVHNLRQRDDSDVAIPKLVEIMQSDEFYAGTWRYETIPVEISLSTAAALTLARFEHPLAKNALAEWLQDHTLPDFSQFIDDL